jgi:hypothetical protein
MVRFSAIESKIMEDVFNSDALAEHNPDVADVRKGAAQWRQMHSDIEAYGKLTKAHGFSKGGTFQRIAHITVDIQEGLERLHAVGCNCSRKLIGYGGHKEWLYEWLAKHGQQYDVRGKVAP